VVSAFLFGFLGGIAGGVIGILFHVGYTKVNKEDKTKFPITVASVLMFVQIVVGELIVTAIHMQMFDMTFGQVFDVFVWIWLILAIVIAYSMFFGYINALKRKALVANRMANSGQDPNNPFNNNININVNNQQNPFGNQFGNQNNFNNNQFTPPPPVNNNWQQPPSNNGWQQPPLNDGWQQPNQFNNPPNNPPTGQDEDPYKW
jgi:hypothetical protein